MIPQWLILAALAGLASSFFNFLNRVFLKEDEDSTAYAWFYELIRAIVFGGIALFDWHTENSSKTFVILLSLGLIEFVSVFVTMKMHYYSHLSISSVLVRLRMLWIPVIAFLFLHDQLSSSEYLGIIILFFGTSIVSSPAKIMKDKGVRFANIAAFVNALTVILFKSATSIASNSAILFTSTLPALFIFPFMMKDGILRILNSYRKKISIKIIAALSAVASGYFTLFALKIGDPSKVNAVYQSMIIFNVLAGIFILKEKENTGKKILGTLITIVGVVLLS